MGLNHHIGHISVTITGHPLGDISPLEIRLKGLNVTAAVFGVLH